jgi:hypothetical protein
MKDKFEVFDGFAFGCKNIFVMGLDGRNILMVGIFVNIIRRKKQG